MHIPQRIVAAAIGATLLGACGSDDAPRAGPTESQAATSSAPSPTRPPSPTPPAFEPEMQIYDVPAGSGPHDVAPAADGGVWYTAQRSGALGHLDPRPATPGTSTLARALVRTG
jgi:streptogramin lyase